MFVDKHSQPSSDPCLPSLMDTFYGSLNSETTLRNITAQFQTGDMQVVVMDFAAGAAFVSNAGEADPVTGEAEKAYDREFTRIDMAAAFEEAAP